MNTNVNLSEQIASMIIAAISEYQPEIATLEITHCAQSDVEARLDLLFSDGQIWSVVDHEHGIQVHLLRLGNTLSKKPLSADIATIYEPALTPLFDEKCYSNNFIDTLREVNCGEGFRQLVLNEIIQDTDEYYQGPGDEGGWTADHLSAGRHYRPCFFETKPGGFALFRRAIK